MGNQHITRTYEIIHTHPDTSKEKRAQLREEAEEAAIHTILAHQNKGTLYDRDE